MPKKSIPTTWCYHHHASHENGVFGEFEFFVGCHTWYFLRRQEIKKNQFQSHLTRTLHSKYLMCPLRSLWDATNWTFMTFFMLVFHKGQIFFNAWLHSCLTNSPIWFSVLCFSSKLTIELLTVAFFSCPPCLKCRWLSNDALLHVVFLFYFVLFFVVFCIQFQ